MSLTIERMCEENLKDIYDFEFENKLFFEKTLPPRPKGYTNFELFKTLMMDLLYEQLCGECHMHVIRDAFGKMIGRINIHSIEGDQCKEAELGYRISEKEQGKGYATEAVKLAVIKGFTEDGLTCIKAGTSTRNIGSQKVLEKNGFKLVGEEKKVMKVKDQWIDGFLYERRDTETE